MSVATDPDDDALMHAFAQGDARAFEHLYARHHAALYRFVRRVLGREAAVHADEVFQDTWLRVVQARAALGAAGRDVSDLAVHAGAPPGDRPAAQERARSHAGRPRRRGANRGSRRTNRRPGRAGLPLPHPPAPRTAPSGAPRASACSIAWRPCPPCSAAPSCCTTRTASRSTSWLVRSRSASRRPRAGCATPCPSCAPAWGPTCRGGKKHEPTATRRRSARRPLAGRPASRTRPRCRAAGATDGSDPRPGTAGGATARRPRVARRHARGARAAVATGADGRLRHVGAGHADRRDVARPGMARRHAQPAPRACRCCGRARRRVAGLESNRGNAGAAACEGGAEASATGAAGGEGTGRGRTTVTPGSSAGRAARARERTRRCGRGGVAGCRRGARAGRGGGPRTRVAARGARQVAGRRSPSAVARAERSRPRGNGRGHAGQATRR